MPWSLYARAASLVGGRLGRDRRQWPRGAVEVPRFQAITGTKLPPDCQRVFAPPRKARFVRIHDLNSIGFYLPSRSEAPLFISLEPDYTSRQPDDGIAKITEHSFTSFPAYRPTNFALKFLVIFYIAFILMFTYTFVVFKPFPGLHNILLFYSNYAIIICDVCLLFHWQKFG